MNDLPLRPAAEIGAVEDRFFTLRNFPLADGTVMPEATIAYETYGRLAPPNGPNGGRNAILCTHGYTGSHHFAGRNPANGNQPGSWDGLIGPGKAIDTDKLFVVASNMLGSSFSQSAIWSRSPVPPMAATRRSNGRSPTPISWTRSCPSTPRPGPRSIPTSNWPS